MYNNGVFYYYIYKNMQTTLVLLKPDTVQRSLIGEVISRLENRGLKINGLKMIALSNEIIEEHYDFLADKPFFPNIVKYMQSAPVVALAVSGKNAIPVIRSLCGATNPVEATPGTIRGDFALTIDANIIHASDSEETAEIELKRFFDASEIYAYEKINEGSL